MELFSTPPASLPAENLAWDEAFLEAAEAGEIGDALWFWESGTPFVVLGYGQKAAVEANLPACAADGVPVLRRCSGGGAVVQGLGCLNYALVLAVPEAGPLATITGANGWIMARQRDAMAKATGEPVTVEGHTDLAIHGVKFSGNAQRRRRRCLLFHGTILYGMNLPLVAKYLRFPSAQPGYRAGRSHADFVRNIPAAPDAIRQSLILEWRAVASGTALPSNRLALAMSERFGKPEWHARM
jgi:lipoate-protein ligase A